MSLPTPLSLWNRCALPGKLVLLGLPLALLGTVLIVQIAEHWEHGIQRLHHTDHILLLFLILAVLCALPAYACFRLLKHEQEGLQQLLAAAPRLSAGDYSPRFVPEGNAESRQILELLNQLLESIEQRQQTLLHEQNYLQESLGSEHLLVEQLRLSASVFEHSLEGIMITDAQGRILEVNPRFTSITGYPREEVIGHNPNRLRSGVHDAPFYQLMWQQLLNTGQWQGELWNRRKNGEIYPEFLSISAIRDDKGDVTHYLGTFSDITLQKRQRQQLEQMAHYDALTGLPNRVLLADRMRIAMANAARHRTLLTVIYLDLDGFKPVNDQFGHQTGDKLLKMIATRLLDGVRSGDTVARIGGDEFVVLLNSVSNLEECEQALARLLHLASEPCAIDGHTICVSASLGAAIYPSDGGENQDADVLMRHADQAMYRAKEAGRNCYRLFNPANPA